MSKHRSFYKLYKPEKIPKLAWISNGAKELRLILDRSGVDFHRNLDWALTDFGSHGFSTLEHRQLCGLPIRILNLFKKKVD